MKLPHRRQFLHLAAGAVALPVLPRIASAQAYPTRPVQLTVGFTKEHIFPMECLSAKENLTVLEKVLNERLGMEIFVSVKTVEGVPEKKEEPLVKNALEMFGGEVVKEWHNE